MYYQANMQQTIKMIAVEQQPKTVPAHPLI